MKFAIIETGNFTRKYMAQKSKSKNTDTTPKHVKNTKTEVKQEGMPALRWYHVAATVVVIALAIIAIIDIFAHFDMSLFGSEYTIKYASGCTSTIAGPIEKSKVSYRYAGIKEGDMYGADGPTDDPGEAILEIVKFGDRKITIKTRDFGSVEWTEREIRYGVEDGVNTDQAPDCMPALTFTISK